MLDFEKLVLEHIQAPSRHARYPAVGHCFDVNNRDYRGYYWYYEGENYILDIHDLYVKEDILYDMNKEMAPLQPYFSLFSTYIVIAQGELISPHQAFNSHQVLCMDLQQDLRRYLLHGGFPYFAVGLKYKRSFLPEAPHYFREARSLKPSLCQELARLSYEILNSCREGAVAEAFFDQMAQEWLSICLKACPAEDSHSLPQDDIEALERVTEYIHQNYDQVIREAVLAKLALLSGSSLKTKFRQHYRMSITEYIQRYRMDMGEELLLQSKLNIAQIAQKVGYRSPSRFSQLFRRYKGRSPHDLRPL